MFYYCNCELIKNVNYLIKILFKVHDSSLVCNYRTSVTTCAMTRKFFCLPI